MRTWLGLWVCGSIAFLGACASNTPKIKFSVPEIHGSLPNGLKVVLLPDDSRTIVTIDMRIDVGSADDPPGKAGLAHLVEHLVYRKRPGGPRTPPAFVRYGELASYFNAYTRLESTHYHAVSAPANLETLLRLEASRIDGDCSTIPREELEREREVVRNEMRLRSEWDTRQTAAPLFAALYGENHPYVRTFAYDDRAFAAITFDEVCAFLKTNYVPVRATLLIGGKVTSAQAKVFLDKYFSSLPAAKVADLASIAFARAGIRQTITLPVEEPHAIIAWPLPARGTLETTVLPLVFDGQRYGDIAYVTGGYLAPALVVQVSASDERSLDYKVAYVLDRAESLREQLQKKPYLERVRDLMVGDLVMRTERPDRRAEMFADFAQFEQGKGSFATHLGQLRSLADDDRLEKAAGALLSSRQATVIRIQPRKSDVPVSLSGQGTEPTFAPSHEVGSAADEDSTAPVPVPATIERLTTARRFTLPNGLAVVLLPRASSVPVVSTRLVVRHGWADDPSGYEGLTWAAMHLIQVRTTESGYTRYGLLTYSYDPMAIVGARSFRNVEPRASYFSARTLEPYLGLVLDALGKWASHGPITDLGPGGMKKAIDAILKNKGFRSLLAYRKTVQAALYGADHDYARLPVPTAESASRIDLATLTRWQQTYLAPANAILVVAGSFDVKQVEDRVRDAFGEWNVAAPPGPPPEMPAHGAAGAVGVVNESLPYVQLTLAYPTARRESSDPADLVLRELIAARGERLRTHLGAAYVVQGVTGPSLYQIDGAVDENRAGESLLALREGLTELKRGELSGFARARRIAVRKLLVDQDDASTLAETAASLVVGGGDTQSLSRLAGEVAAMTPERVQQVIMRRLVSANEVVVAMGKRKALEAMFAKAGMNDVRWVMAE